MEFKETIKQRIKDLEEQQETILKRLQHNRPNVNQVIKYGEDLNKLNIKIEELQLMLWQ